MLEKILGLINRLLNFVFGDPSEPKRDGIEKDGRPATTGVEKLPALPITDKYEKIDWENNPPQYRKRTGVLTFHEQQFHRLLVSLIGRNHQILSMVRMADVMYLSNETEDRKFHNNNILCKHFDYVICDKRKFEPLLVIELDDPKHLYVFRKEIDEFKEKACNEAGLPLLRFEVRENYDRTKIGEQIRQKIANSVQEN